MYDYFNSPRLKYIGEHIRISVFAENNLSDNVIKESATLYHQLSLENEKYKNNYANIVNCLHSLRKNPEFHKICDTTQYEIFIPAVQYANDIETIEKYIKSINMKCLRNRMLRGLRKFKDINTQLQSDASDVLTYSDISNSSMYIDDSE